MTTSASAGSQRPTLLGHPRGLFMLFFSEMWERFSFYGMRALLTLYMVKVLAYDDDASAGVYGAYGALVYLTPVLGGWMAEKLLGYRHSIILGGTLMAIGHALMAIENEVFFYVALGYLCIGNGFFKPNISSTVGKLYEEGDPRRDAGFTIFYMGINLGALLAPWVCGPLGENVGWHYGFGAAAIGMVLGLVVFIRGQKNLEGRGEPRDPEKLMASSFMGISNLNMVWVLSLISAPLIAVLLWQNEFTGYLIYATGAIVLFVLFKMATAEEKVGRDRLFALMILMVFHMMFWAFFEQAGSSLTLFADRVVNRDMPLLGEQPASWFQGVNPFFILAFAPLFSTLWVKLAAKNKQPSIPVKFALGLLQLGAGFGVLVFGMAGAEPGIKIGWMFLVLMYALHTTGELCLSPVGLSAVTKLAPAKATGFVMGAWFLTISFGHKIAGEIAKLTKVDFKMEDQPVLHVLTEGIFKFEGAGEEVTPALANLAMPEEVKDGKTLVQIVEALSEQGVEAQAVIDHCVQSNFFSADAGTQLTQIVGSAGGTGEGANAAAEALNAHTVGPILDSYLPVYDKVFYVALGSGVLLLILSRPIRKLMHGVE